MYAVDLRFARFRRLRRNWHIDHFALVTDVVSVAETDRLLAMKTFDLGRSTYTTFNITCHALTSLGRREEWSFSIILACGAEPLRTDLKSEWNFNFLKNSSLQLWNRKLMSLLFLEQSSAQCLQSMAEVGHVWVEDDHWPKFVVSA